MDDDISFGDVEQTSRQRRLRPDQNRHYAVVPYDAPDPGDLRIYIDVDALRDMETHARSNTEVELGGVLLGGQYEDDEGQPFVLITDSLRAEHYESTKGSFKFTHDTWRDITRKRDEFPEDMQMVGWYHTHPGWGVFLSGMDTFICDHFFNKPLDVALVIDPCQSERAFFQWTTEGAQKTRPTNGFHVIGSRFRLPELEIYTAQLEGKTAMPSDPRYRELPGAYPPTIVQIPEPRQSWVSVAVLGMLTMQFLVLALIAWRVLAPGGSDPSARVDRRDKDLAAQREMLDQIIGNLQVAPDGIVQSLEEQRQEKEKIESANLGLLAHIRELNKQNKKAKGDTEYLKKRTEQLTEGLAKLRDDKKELAIEVRKLKNQVAANEEVNDEGAATGLWAWMTRWKWYISGALVVLVAAAAALFAVYGPSHETEQTTASEDDDPELENDQ